MKTDQYISWVPIKRCHSCYHGYRRNVACHAGMDSWILRISKHGYLYPCYFQNIHNFMDIMHIKKRLWIFVTSMLKRPDQTDRLARII